MGDSMERRSSERQTMVLNQFSRCQFKRRSGTGRLTTKRPISFENLLLSGKKPLPPAMSSLYKNISTTLKENVNPEPRNSQNVDDFWAVERQKRISAVARRKLTGAKETTQEVQEQPVEDRKARHARSRRAGGSRAVGAKAKKLDVFIDAELIADWDKENLEVEEEKPCTIESSMAFLSAQETALRASLKILNTMDDRVEAVPGTCYPTHSQVNACKVNGEPKAQTPGPYDHATNGKSSSSLEDMDLSSGESPDSLIQNIMNPHDCTPDLASLVEMDWNTSCPPRAALENALNSQDTLRYQVQDDSTLDTQRQTFSSSFHEPPDKLRGDCLVANSRADRCSLLSTAQLRARQFEQEGRVNEDQGCISSLLMHCSLDKNVSCTNRDGTPFHDAESQRTRLPTTSPTPPSNPFAVYMSRRQLLNETGELSQRKLAFGSCSPSSSPDFGEDCQNEDIPDVEVDWDRISYNDDPQDVAVPEREHEVANTDHPQDSPGKKSRSGSSFPHDGSNAQKVQVVPYEGTETERYVRHVIESQESCSMHVNVQSESRRKSGSNFRTESLRGKSKGSSGVDGPRTSTVLAIKTMQADKAGLSAAAKALFPGGDKGAETPIASNLHASAFNSEKTKKAEKVDLNAGKALSCEGPIKDTPRFDKPPFSPIKSLKTKQVEKTRLSSAAKSLRFEDQDNSSPRLCEAPHSASKSVKEKKAEKTGLPIAAKALNFEDTEVEAALDAEEAKSLMEEPYAEVGLWLPVDYEENTSKPCASQQCLPDDITSETKTCVDLESQRDDITADIQPCTNLESQADSVAAAKLQPEPRQQSQAKKPRRRKVQDRRSSLEGSENGCTWKGGQRRSQRIRVRPLEWWRGEKLLYGRVHDSLTSVIGIKQSSPGQYARGIKAPFVIESFVPSKYSELVRFAAI